MNYHGVEFSQDELQRFCRKHGIVRLALFGSVLREDFSADSDIDVLVEFAPHVRVGLRFFQIERELSELLGRQVDLNTPGFLSRYFRDQVLAEAEVQYEAA
jgi:predicted nucleotidyltransferase